MLVVVVGEVALALDLAHAAQAVGGGELRHDEAAAGMLVGGLAGHVSGAGAIGVSEEGSILDEAAENRVSHTGHRSKDSRGRDVHGPYAELSRDRLAHIFWSVVRNNGGVVIPILLHAFSDCRVCVSA